MEYSALIRERHSVRAYRSDPVEDEMLAQVLEAARMAPTTANRQPFQLVVIHTAGRKQDLMRIYPRDWFTQAPLVICACGVPSQGWVHRDGKTYWEVDVAIAMDHLILAAANLGLGTCWIAAFDRQAARDVLGLPNDVEPLLFTPLGYPADKAGPKMRKSIEQLVRYEKW